MDAERPDAGSRGAGEADDADRRVVEWAFAQSPVTMTVFDTQLRYWRVNEASGDIIGVGEAEVRGLPFIASVPENEASEGYLQHLRQVVETGVPVSYETVIKLRSAPREYARTSWMWPVRDPSGAVCAVAIAAFDSSEQHWARQRLALLNEAGTSLGTSLDVELTGVELARLAVPRFADFVTVDLLEDVLRGAEPVPGAVQGQVALRRVAHESVDAGVPEAVVELGTVDTYPPFAPAARALAGGRPVLSGPGEPDHERWLAQDEVRSATARRFKLRWFLAVPLRARGLTLGVVVFIRRESHDPFDAEEVLLAEELATRAALCVDNARRYTREHATALALQRNLLPSGLPAQAAVEVTSRYLPADASAGVGGDWFDVIALSGTRVALVVGDVVGHGINASATMGRLRTAVRTLADVDLPPDELLVHLDDLVAHLGAEEDSPWTEAGGGQEQSGTAVTGATCLYAVYDPVSGRCTVASAGHPAPVLLRPGGTAEVVRISPGPPLGVGGLPFEATELDLPEGSLLALYTDGLVESRRRDLDAGVELMCRALAAPSRSLDATCDTIFTGLLDEHPADDAALLVARTRLLGAGRVATLDVAHDPAQVAEARKWAGATLAGWGLDDAAFVTELVVSELVTNAIRYGQGPVRLRLIRDRTLICEVSDASNTAPHLRRARTLDEGGRGLLLVAQLTQGWGTRQTALGKTIWAEQQLPAGASPTAD